MIDELRIKAVRKAMGDSSLPDDIRKKLEMVVYQLDRNPAEQVVVDSMRVNTILNDIGIKTDAEEKEGSSVEVRFKIKRKNPIPSPHFLPFPHSGDAFDYYAQLSDTEFWIISPRYHIFMENAACSPTFSIICL